MDASLADRSRNLAGVLLFGLTVVLLVLAAYSVEAVAATPWRQGLLGVDVVNCQLPCPRVYRTTGNTRGPGMVRGL